MFIVPRCVVENSQHGNKPIAVTVGPSDVGSTSADAVDIETDAPSRLGDQSTLLQGVINTFTKTVNIPIYI